MNYFQFFFNTDFSRLPNSRVKTTEEPAIFYWNHGTSETSLIFVTFSLYLPIPYWWWQRKDRLRAGSCAISKSIGNQVSDCLGKLLLSRCIKSFFIGKFFLLNHDYVLSYCNFHAPFFDLQ